MKRILMICLLIPFMTSAMFAVNIVYPTGLTITGYNGPILEGNNLQLQAIPTPSNTDYHVYKWSSSNTSVATVSSSGLVTAVSEGTATITCRLAAVEQSYFLDSHEQSATCDITVEKNMALPITFADDAVKALCVANWDTNGDEELSFAEAAAVTTIGQLFQGNAVITSFDELQYFTGLTRISDNAFEHCENLTSVVIPASITQLGYNNSNYAFNPFCYCNSLTSLSVAEGNAVYASPNGCNAIIETATNKLIAGCNSSTIPNGVVTLGNLAFAGFPNITSVTLPSSVKTLENQVFIDCPNLTSVNLGQVEEIGYSCFSAPLTSIHVPATVEQIDWSNPFAVFYGTIETITVDANNPYYDSRDDCNAIIAKNFGNTLLSDGKPAVNVLVSGCENTVIPSSVRAIGKSAFKYCKMTTIEIPEGVESILSSAFQKSDLQSIVLPKSLTFLDEAAFYRCNSLTSVTVQNAEPLPIADNTFSNRANATLYVPHGCRAAYVAADYWKEFKTIVEMGPPVTDIDQLSDAIYIKPFSSGIGGNNQIEICLKNAQDVTAYVFDLELPEGVTVATDDNHHYLDELGERHDDHLSGINYRGKNTYCLATLSANNEVLSGNDEPIRLLTLHVADDLTAGKYAITIKNASYAKPNGTLVSLENTTSVITLTDYIKGDANGDGNVSVVDVISTINYILQDPPEQFDVKAADVNGDGEISVVDVIGIIDIILNQN